MMHIGKRYSFKHFNCWDYAVLIRSEQGLTTKKFNPINIGNAFDVITAEMQKINHGLVKVDEPQDFDIVIIKTMKGDRATYHCGIMFEGGVAHCCQKHRQVVYSTFNEFINNTDGVTFWR